MSLESLRSKISGDCGDLGISQLVSALVRPWSRVSRYNEGQQSRGKGSARFDQVPWLVGTPSQPPSEEKDILSFNSRPKRNKLMLQNKKKQGEKICSYSSLKVLNKLFSQTVDFKSG